MNGFTSRFITSKGRRIKCRLSKKNYKSLKRTILDTFGDKKVVIGTHGAVMTLMMGYFDSAYDLNFLHSTSKPDIYRIEFKEMELVNVQRIWGVNC